MSDFHTVKIKSKVNETTECVTLYFDIPSDLKKEFEFYPGQYLTLKADINGEDVRRAYSISTSTIEEELGVSIKEVANGKMSTYLNRTIKEGDVIEIMKPDGRFKIITNENLQRDHYFFAAGSGITPIMSMIKTVLEKEPKSSVYLLYGSRDEDNIIFKDQLAKISSKYRGQFYSEITLSKPTKTKSSGIMGLLGKSNSNWNGLKGRVDSAKVVDFIRQFPPKSTDDEYYICGPGNMIDQVKSTLIGNEIKESKIHQEHFASGDQLGSKTVVSSGNAQLIATFQGDEITINVPAGKTVLDTMLDEGHGVPYSCSSGACSTCMAKVIEGAVEMESCFALDDDEIKDGYILTCQAQITTPVVKINFDV